MPLATKTADDFSQVLVQRGSYLAHDKAVGDSATWAEEEEEEGEEKGEEEQEEQEEEK